MDRCCGISDFPKIIEKKKIWCNPSFKNAHNLGVEEEDNILRLIGSKNVEKNATIAFLQLGKQFYDYWFLVIGEMVLSIDTPPHIQITGDGQGFFYECNIKIKGEWPRSMNWENEDDCRIVLFVKSRLKAIIATRKKQEHIRIIEKSITQEQGEDMVLYVKIAA